MIIFYQMENYSITVYFLGKAKKYRICNHSTYSGDIKELHELLIKSGWNEQRGAWFKREYKIFINKTLLIEEIIRIYN